MNEDFAKQMLLKMQMTDLMREFELRQWAEGRWFGRILSTDSVTAGKLGAAAWAQRLAVADLGIAPFDPTWFEPALPSDYVRDVLARSSAADDFIVRSELILGLASPNGRVCLSAAQSELEIARTTLHEARHLWQFEHGSIDRERNETDARTYAARFEPAIGGWQYDESVALEWLKEGHVDL